MMQRINLLPWRDALLRKQKHRFGIRLSLFSLSLIAVVYLIGFSLNDALYWQQSRNQYLLDEIARQNKGLKSYAIENEKYSALEKKLLLVNQLQNERNNATLLFNLLPEITPQDVVLEKISMRNGLVSIESRARGNTDLTKMLALLEQHQSIESVKMHSIVSLNAKGESLLKATFSLTQFTQVNLIEENNG